MLTCSLSIAKIVLVANTYNRGGCIHRILSGLVCLCVGSPCPLYPLPTYQKDANVIMILEGSYNHLANSAGMG